MSFGKNSVPLRAITHKNLLFFTFFSLSLSLSLISKPVSKSCAFTLKRMLQERIKIGFISCSINVFFLFFLLFFACFFCFLFVIFFFNAHFKVLNFLFSFQFFVFNEKFRQTFEKKSDCDLIGPRGELII